MPAKKARARGTEPVDPGTQLRLIANLLGVLATKDMGEGDKIVTLNAVGFGNQEIARLLRKDVNTVRVTLSLRRNKANAKRKK